ncbi:MAG: amidohydrolase family protein, partial [Ilumatobacteraceae bacterium]
MHDLVIRGGFLVDGSGAPGRFADIAVEHGTIAEIAEAGSISPGSASTTLDADGLLVTPGWVDVHTHYDGQASWDPYLTPSSWHGVTT